MTKLLGWIAAPAIAAAIVTATPAMALHGDGFGGGANFGGRGLGDTGGIRMGRQVSVSGFHDPACFRHHRHFRDFAVVGGPFLYDYAGYGNYCWQQVWTPSGWQWLDACAGYYGFGY
jgi:hypothetical protein